MSAAARLVAAVTVAAALLGGCGRTVPDGRLLRLPPPPNWEHELERARAVRDEYFRSDPQAPLLPEQRADFAGLDYYAADPVYYFAGPILDDPQPETFRIVTTSGQWRDCERVGRVEFEIDGQPLSLRVYRLLDSPPQEGGAAYFLPFMDATTGSETYPSGRYIDLQGPAGGPYVLDFNRAYNPSCAYGAPERYACPVTPAENRLPVRIEAGERGYRADGDG